MNVADKDPGLKSNREVMDFLQDQEDKIKEQGDQKSKRTQRYYRNE